MTRSRNATLTKTAILEAARIAFAAQGFDQVGVRDIATRAGVNAALVIRYFGSKEQLFARAVSEAETGNLEAVFQGEKRSLGARLARYTLEKTPQGNSLDGLITLLRSAPNPQAATLLRAALESQFIKPLAARLEGEGAEMRAGLIAAQIIGLAVTRTLILSEPLGSAAIEPLIHVVANGFQALIDNEINPTDVAASGSATRSQTPHRTE